jgi:mannose-6-phosphate isomerase-like protein (cupin superfamily)
LEIEPGLPHEARNDSGEPVEFLVISQPPGHGDRDPAPAT